MKAISLVTSAASRALLRHQNLIRHLPTISTKFHSQVPQLGARTRTRTRTRSHERSNSRLIVTAASGVDPMKSSGVPESVPVRVAHELVQAGHHYLDVRTPEEFSQGHPSGAVNVPYMFKARDGMAKNPNFLDEVAKHFGKDAEIVVGCQSGKRSLMAATDLSAAGFSGVTDVAGGYSAWTQGGLPTE